MNKKIVLIDGFSILFRAFYGLPSLTNSAGEPTNAVYGFLNILFKILDDESPDLLTIAFDVSGPTFRHDMYEEYKGTRKPMPEDLVPQVPLIKEVLTAMKISIVEKAGYEADDIIGTLANKSEKLGYDVSVVSGDRDLLQLATEKVKIIIPKTKRTGTEIEEYFAKDVKEKYQVSPTEFIDVKGLMGDASDNIPGVPGIGEKTATKIIVEYGSIENAHAHIEDIKPKRAKESLGENYDIALLSKELATIITECELDFNIKDSTFDDIYNEDVFVIFKKLEFQNFLNRFDMEVNSYDKIEDHFTLISSLDKAQEVFDFYLGNKPSKNHVLAMQFIIDEDTCLGLSITFASDKVYFIKIDQDITVSYLSKQLSSLLDNKYVLSTINLKEQLDYLNISNNNKIYDIGIASYLLNPLKSTYNFDDVARDYLNMTIQSRKELFGKKGLKEVMNTNEDDFLMFACYESFVAFKAYDSIFEQLKKTDMYDLFINIEMPLVYTLFDMEKRGIRTNKEALKEYGDKLAVRIGELEKTIYEQAGEEFNINSPKQLGVILFEKLNLPFGKKTKTGYSTAASVLEKLVDYHPIINQALEYRQLAKLKSTYADGLANYIGEDNKIHSKFHQTITATGRISSTDPNLQNIPIRMELGRAIRKVFTPEEGFVFVDADYSQIELRVLAHMSGDESLIEAYQHEDDIHKITASKVFHTPLDEVTSLQRSNAKAVNFGIVYGISSFGLGQDLNISRKEAEEYIEQYFKTYPQIKEFLDNLVREAEEKGYVNTIFGRRRPIPELKSSNFMQRSFGKRVAMNSPIQGTAADIIKIAMNRVNQELKNRKLDSRLILQVHDELLIEAKIEELEEVKDILITEMKNATKLRVPLELGVNIGENWYEVG
ncbi:MAG TPA: DNA polymerase I [Clostridiales bacterium]|nr:DNA polymerase I [Clostridiales bacterium]